LRANDAIVPRVPPFAPVQHPLSVPGSERLPTGITRLPHNTFGCALPYGSTGADRAGVIGASLQALLNFNE
jgi:hypothetical protein